MLYLYCAIVAGASLLFAVFCRAAMLGLGLVPNFGSGLLLIFCTGSLYILVQAAFMAAMRLYQPTKARSTYLTEIASNASVILLIPYILHVSIPWPSSVLLRVEPLLYLCAFGGLQFVTKLATFYGSHRGRLENRTGALGYVIASIVSLTLSIVLANQWLQSLDAARTSAPVETESMAFDDGIYAHARSILEGSTLSQKVEFEPGQTITTRWSATPDEEFERVYATFVLQGKETAIYEKSVSIEPGRLGEIRVPNAVIPEGFRSFEMRWTRTKEPNWQRMLGLRPIVYALPETPGGPVPPAHSAIMSGPFVHGERPMARGGNVILIVVDGLAANHVSMMGYSREVTPALDKLAYAGLSYPNGNSYTADPGQALEAMLCGVNELSLSVPGGHESIVTRLAEAGYSTVAFTEGAHVSDSGLQFGEGLEQGFELFDEGYRSEQGSRATVERAQRWIGEHEWVKFFMVIRIRDLADYQTFDPGEGGFSENGRTRAIDSYDNALLDIDSKLGSLLKFVRDRDTRKNTYIIVASPYGHAFSLDRSGRALDETTMRTPIIINGPGLRKAKLPKKASIEDIGPTISKITGVAYSGRVDGSPLN